MNQDVIFVTGGAGFIGSNFVHHWLARDGGTVVNLDKLTYAGNLGNLRDLEGDPGHVFARGDICDVALVSGLLSTYRPWAIVHLAAESHVDRSIHGPEEFLQTNVIGTFRLLECAREYWSGLPPEQRERFRFLHVSTDEVFGSLAPADAAFSERTPYAPSSPYSASKAGSDHFVRAYFRTYGLPALVTNCSNNYGPYQFPEKLIPLMILNALEGEPLPVYGDGMQVRDWLYVEDHCDALRAVLRRGRPGETYNIGGNSEKRNLDVVREICAILDELRPAPAGTPHASLVASVADRPGHDRRYAMDTRKIAQELGWSPRESFDSGLHKTVSWYVANRAWARSVMSGDYRDWVERNYAARKAR